jgi:hypothetical protein
MWFDPKTLWLRHLRLGDHECVRAIYPAVRDQNWGTLAPVVEECTCKPLGGGFEVRLDVSYQSQGEPFFRWRLSLTGTSDGSVIYRAKGTALQDFQTNRTGFCVLHPAAVASLPVSVRDRRGEWREDRFPQTIAPHQPFFDVTAMEYALGSDLRLKLRFLGDVFETEDQRNWTDASFKTYCRPLAHGFPYVLLKGMRVYQSIELSLLGADRSTASVGPKTGSIPIAESDELVEAKPLPTIGLLETGKLPYGAEDSDFWESQPRWLEWTSGPEEAGLSVGLAPGVPFGVTVVWRNEDKPGDWIRVLREVAPENVFRDACWLPIDGETHTTTPHARAAWEEVLHTLEWPVDRIGGGSRANFAEFNRGAPLTEESAFAACAVNPQVHAFDEESIVETLEVWPQIVAQMRNARPDLPVWLTPVTLRPLFNPVATESSSVPPKLPPADPRLGEPFGAAWTLAAIFSAHQAGADGLWLHGTGGEMGLWQADGRLRPVGKALTQFLEDRPTRGDLLFEKGSSIPVGGVFEGLPGTILWTVNLQASPRRFRFQNETIELFAWGFERRILKGK